jgi:hypothetical protein
MLDQVVAKFTYFKSLFYHKTSVLVILYALKWGRSGEMNRIERKKDDLGPRLKL